MKQEYDFSKGEREKFFRENAKLNLPIYLDEEVQNYLRERAKSKGVEIAQLVNEMLRQDIKLIGDGEIKKPTRKRCWQFDSSR